jgi:hypothetical protein
MPHLIRKLSRLFGRNRFRSELDEEMAFHRAQAEQEFEMKAWLRRRRTTLQFGNSATQPD